VDSVCARDSKRGKKLPPYSAENIADDAAYSRIYEISVMDCSKTVVVDEYGCGKRGHVRLKSKGHYNY
jgi:hypothetical protein